MLIGRQSKDLRDIPRVLYIVQVVIPIGQHQRSLHRTLCGVVSLQPTLHHLYSFLYHQLTFDKALALLLSTAPPIITCANIT